MSRSPPRNKTGSLSLVSAGGVTLRHDRQRQLRAANLELADARFDDGERLDRFDRRATLGIQPQDWAVNPRVVGSDRIDGVATTRIHAGVDAEKLVADLSTLLPKLSSLGLSSSIGQLSSVIAQLPKRLPAADQRQVAAEMHDPYVDLWTGSSDHILRKLILSFDDPGRRPAGGQGCERAPRGYADPAVQRSEPATDDRCAHQDPAVHRAQGQGECSRPAIRGGHDLYDATDDTTPHKARAKHNRAPELTLSPYAQCIANAEGDFTKMRKCASLSNGTSTRAR